MMASEGEREATDKWSWLRVKDKLRLRSRSTTRTQSDMLQALFDEKQAADPDSPS
jgi:hypothetical protein